MHLSGDKLPADPMADKDKKKENAFGKQNTSIDEKLADKYLDHVKPENQDRLLELQIDAHHAAYESTNQYLEKNKIEYGKKIKDEKVVNDILFEYIGTLMEEMHVDKGWKDAFKKRKFDNESDRLAELINVAQSRLYIPAEKIQAIKKAIHKNKKLKQTLESEVGEPIRNRQLLEAHNQQLYQTVFNHPDHKIGAFGEWLDKKTKGLYEETEEAALRYLKPEQFYQVMPIIANGDDLPSDYLKEVKLKKRDREIKK